MTTISPIFYTSLPISSIIPLFLAVVLTYNLNLQKWKGIVIDTKNIIEIEKTELELYSLL